MAIAIKAAATAVLMNLNDRSDDRVNDVTDAIAHSLFGETPAFQRQSR